ncbi:MAG: 3-dehydroquinate synthase [Kiritimatiellae bacterium]|nr:3-dehydroquinate synthase [Kiritimatiellia bacterium]
MSHIFLYGPPGSGKSTIGRKLALKLARPFFDLDKVIEAKKGCAVSEIFAKEGEPAFRALECAVLKEVAANQPSVISLGGGTLLNAENRTFAEQAGKILCLRADPAALLARMARTPGSRPLATDPDTAAKLLESRAGHYASFPLYLVSGTQSFEEMVEEAELKLCQFAVTGMGAVYPVEVADGLLETLAPSPTPHAVVVGDSHTLPLYGRRLAERLSMLGFDHVERFEIPAGETTKTLETVSRIWSAFLHGGIERRDTVFALGGGVVGDLTGFAAATWLRGVSWVGVPTSLLAMVDSSLGGKTGADLPEGKNLIGAFHPPRAVLADTATLATLPPEELRCGYAEAIKHAVIADPGLLDALPSPADFAARSPNVAPFVARAMAVKIRYIQSDPLEKGLRAALNLGHTIGHGIEKATDFRVKHGEGVAIGTVYEAKLAEAMGLAKPGLAQTIAKAFRRVGLPVELPVGINLAAVKEAMTHDKKKAGGIVRFALPAALGDVRTGVAVPPEVLDAVLR